MPEDGPSPVAGPDPRVRVEDRDRVRWITLDRPEALNALDASMTRSLHQALESARGDESVGCVVLTGTGRGFSAGADLETLRHAPADAAATMDGAAALVRSVVGLDKPVVAAVNGVAAGVACGAALAADLVVAAESALFLLPFATLGLMPDGGSSLTVAASIGRARAMRMALLAEPLTAAEAHDAGLVSHLVADVDLLEATATIARRLARGPAIALTATKRAVNAATLPDLEAVLDREGRGQRALFTTHDFAEGLAAFGEGRRASFRGE